MAEGLFYALKKRGINAFYSNISIAEKGEYRFGKMINEALVQSSIFVAVGTSIENLQSEWVAYELETFHGELLNHNKARTRSAMFSYITKNVETNLLPMELRRCQAFYTLQDIVFSICARFQKEHEVLQNFTPRLPPAEKLSFGMLIDGRYKIIQEVGRGGTSIVYLAMDIRLNKLWAVKVVKKESITEFAVVKQSLTAETALLKKLAHPSLPRIVDMIDDGESFMIIMDYIEGSSLDSILQECGVQSEDTVIDWAKQLCDVLSYLHAQNPQIIYRDLKPANVILKPSGRLTLIDFGTAREYKEQNLADTVCLGTMGYAAPEQFGGIGQTDQRTDIYSLGITLYFLCTGLNPAQPPYEMVPIRQIRKELSRGLEFIIDKCTQRDPAERYQTATELMNDLNNIEKINSRLHRKNLIRDALQKFRRSPKKSANMLEMPQRKNEHIHAEIISLENDNKPESPACASEQILQISTIENFNTTLLRDKVAVCVAAKEKIAVGDRVNVYFVTRNSKEDIAKLISLNGEDTKVELSDKVVDITHSDTVAICLQSNNLVFNCSEYEFSWIEFAENRFHVFFSFEVTEIKSEGIHGIRIELCVNNEKITDTRIEL